MVAHVGRVEPSVRFLGRKVEKGEDGRTLLAVDVENTGDGWLVPTVWTELVDPSGAVVGRAETMPKRLYPDCSGRFWLDLGPLGPGTYDALVVVDGGGDAVFGTKLNVDVL
jgi:hypothetical protein